MFEDSSKTVLFAVGWVAITQLFYLFYLKVGKIEAFKNLIIVVFYSFIFYKELYEKLFPPIFYYFQVIKDFVIADMIILGPREISESTKIAVFISIDIITKIILRLNIVNIAPELKVSKTNITHTLNYIVVYSAVTFIFALFFTSVFVFII